MSQIAENALSCNVEKSF